MRYLFLGALVCALFMTSCKSKSEKTTSWVLKKEGTWLALQTEFTRTIVNQSTAVDTGVVNSNGVFAFTSETEGNFEMVLPFLSDNWLEPFQWSTEDDTVRAFTDQTTDAVGGTSVVTFKAWEISKKQMRMNMLYLYTTATETETLDMELNLQRRD